MITFINNKDEKAVAKSIREGYEQREQTDLERLRKLDAKVRRPAEIAAYTIGIIGALILGVGMCIAMEVIGTSSLMPLGIVVGVVGIAIVSANYFIYKAILKSRKKKYASQVIELSDKLLNE